MLRTDLMALRGPTARARQTDWCKHSGVGARAPGQLGKQLQLIDSIHSREHRPCSCCFLFPSRELVTSSPPLSPSLCLSWGQPFFPPSFFIAPLCSTLSPNKKKKMLLSVSLWRRNWNSEARDGGKFSAFTLHLLLFDGQDESPYMS